MSDDDEVVDDLVVDDTNDAATIFVAEALPPDPTTEPIQHKQEKTRGRIALWLTWRARSLGTMTRLGMPDSYRVA